MGKPGKLRKKRGRKKKKGTARNIPAACVFHSTQQNGKKQGGRERRGGESDTKTDSQILTIQLIREKKWEREGKKKKGTRKASLCL